MQNIPNYLFGSLMRPSSKISMFNKILRDFTKLITKCYSWKNWYKVTLISHEILSDKSTEFQQFSLFLTSYCGGDLRVSKCVSDFHVLLFCGFYVNFSLFFSSRTQNKYSWHAKPFLTSEQRCIFGKWDTLLVTMR